ncbi:MAG TPA: FHA domain-containing protein [Acidimicrobiales bacterium]|jgi:pSer/pThr/pTyr-binding forkhead associated (FHA) protein
MDSETTITYHPPADDDEVGTVSVVREPVAVLVVTRGPNAGSRYALDTNPTRIGRHPDSDIFLDDITVSRHHAEVHETESGWVVRDTDSLNGTYLNRTRVEDGPLANGDEIQIGRFKLTFFPSE